MLTDALMDSHAEADVSGWVAGEAEGVRVGVLGCGPAAGSWLAAPRNIGILNCAARGAAGGDFIPG